MKGFKSLRITSCMILILGCFFVETAESKTQHYANCIKAPDPSACLVSLASKSRHTSPSELFEGVVMTGAINVVKLKPKALIEGARESLHSKDVIFKSLGIKMPLGHVQKNIKKSKDKVILAAVALAAAAQKHKDPFAEPIVKDLINEAGTVTAVSVIAAKFWFNIDTYSIFNEKSTFPPGLHKIWSVIVESPNLDEKLLVSLATADTFTQNAKALQLPLYQRFLSLPETSKNSKIKIASVFASQYGYVEDAKKLMLEGGKDAENYDVESVTASIAEAELLRGYNAEAAQIVVNNLLRESVLEYTNYRCLCESSFKALQVAHANEELKFLAKFYLEQANNKGLRPEQRANFYALSSDCYLRAEEKARAIEAAKLGLSVVPLAVFYRLNEDNQKEGIADPQKQAKFSQGFGTYPVVALYRAGAIKEALTTGYLTGFDRYKNADFVGEKPDPQWVIDYNWPIAFSSMVSSAIENPNIEFRTQVYKVLKKYNSENDDYDNLKYLSVLAASTGDKDAMIEHLSAYARSLDKARAEEGAYFAIDLAEQWLRDMRILNSQRL